MLLGLTLVRERNGELVVVQPSRRRFDPVLQAVALPVLRPEQDDAGSGFTSG
jgi:hypothetical protein